MPISDTCIEIAKFRLTLIENGIIENYIKPGVTVEASDLWELKRLNLMLAEEKPYCVLTVSGHLSSISKEARETVASKTFAGITKAKALVVDSLGQRIVGNFYLTVNKPHIKTKIFGNREEAIVWLREQQND